MASPERTAASAGGLHAPVAFQRVSEVLFVLFSWLAGDCPSVRDSFILLLALADRLPVDVISAACAPGAAVPWQVSDAHWLALRPGLLGGTHAAACWPAGCRFPPPLPAPQHRTPPRPSRSRTNNVVAMMLPQSLLPAVGDLVTAARPGLVGHWKVEALCDAGLLRADEVTKESLIALWSNVHHDYQTDTRLLAAVQRQLDAVAIAASISADTELMQLIQMFSAQKQPLSKESPAAPLGTVLQELVSVTEGFVGVRRLVAV